jgi:hypothetical protein
MLTSPRGAKVLSGALRCHGLPGLSGRVAQQQEAVTPILILACERVQEGVPSL